MTQPKSAVIAANALTRLVPAAVRRRLHKVPALAARSAHATLLVPAPRPKSNDLWRGDVVPAPEAINTSIRFQTGMTLFLLGTSY